MLAEQPVTVLFSAAITKTAGAVMLNMGNLTDTRKQSMLISAQTAKENNISNTALILVGGFLGKEYERSRLYDPGFSTGFREAKP